MPNLPQPVNADGEIIAYNDNWKHLPFLDDEGLQEQMTNRIFTAETLDDAMAPITSALKLRDFAGTDVVVHAAWLRPSDIEDSAQKVYALIDLEDELGQRKVVSNGSAQVISVIARAAKEDKLPLKARVFEGVANSKGKSNPLYLVRRTRAGDESF